MARVPRLRQAARQGDARRALDPSEQQAWGDVARAVFEETMFAVRLTLIAQLNDSLDALG